MPTSIHQRVRLANAGQLPNAIIHLKSGWVVAFDPQTVPGYCLLLSDPVASSINDLDEAARTQYLLDMTRVGDALLKATDAYRINYETWCNVDPALHTHIVPRYKSEPDDKRVLPVCKAYDPKQAPAFDPQAQASFIENMRRLLAPYAR